MSLWLEICRSEYLYRCINTAYCKLWIAVHIFSEIVLVSMFCVDCALYFVYLYRHLLYL